MTIRRIFTPDHVRWDGVRPINIYLLRMLYLLMAVFVATDAWGGILRHEGPWDPIHAVALSVWATYPLLGILGLVHPLRMLPLMVFMIGYKSLWLAIVAYPLWRAGTLAGSPAGDMAQAFMALPIAIIAVPWGYFVRQFVLPRRADASRA